MAGRGRTPKPNRSRVRDNRGWQDVAGDGYCGPFIPLPSSYRAFEGGQQTEVHYLATTSQWFERCVRGPQATTWTAADFDYLRLVVAPCFDQVQRGAHGRMAELRLQLVELGLTLGARQRLRMRIEPARPAPQPVDADPGSKPRSESNRDILSALVDEPHGPSSNQPHDAEEAP